MQWTYFPTFLQFCPDTTLRNVDTRWVNKNRIAQSSTDRHKFFSSSKTFVHTQMHLSPEITKLSLFIGHLPRMTWRTHSMNKHGESETRKTDKQNHIILAQRSGTSWSTAHLSITEPTDPENLSPCRSACLGAMWPNCRWTQLFTQHTSYEPLSPGYCGSMSLLCMHFLSEVGGKTVSKIQQMSFSSYAPQFQRNSTASGLGHSGHSELHNNSHQTQGYNIYTWCEHSAAPPPCRVPLWHKVMFSLSTTRKYYLGIPIWKLQFFPVPSIK